MAVSRKVKAWSYSLIDERGVIGFGTVSLVLPHCMSRYLQMALETKLLSCSCDGGLILTRIVWVLSGSNCMFGERIDGTNEPQVPLRHNVYRYLMARFAMSADCSLCALTRYFAYIPLLVIITPDQR